MSVVEKYKHTLEWTGEAHSTVVCTGDFDNWSGSIFLDKGSDGKWKSQVEVPYSRDAEQSRIVRYKYVVDGTWQHADDQAKSTDDSGNVNNFFTVPEIPAAKAIEPASTTLLTHGEIATSNADTDAADASQSSKANNEAISFPSVNDSSSLKQADIPTTIAEIFGQLQNGFIDDNATSRKSNGTAFPSGDSSFDASNFRTHRKEDMNHLRLFEAVRVAYPSAYVQQGHNAYDQIEAGYAELEKSKMPENGNDPNTNEARMATIASNASTGSGTDVEVALAYQLLRLRTSASTGTEPGLPKVLASIREVHPTWQISEKRLKRIVKDNLQTGPFFEADRILRLSGIPAAGTALTPISRTDDILLRDMTASHVYPPSVTPAAAAKPVDGSNETAKPGDDASSSARNSKKKGKKSVNRPPTNGTVAQVADSVQSAVDAVADLAVNAVDKTVSRLADAEAALPLTNGPNGTNEPHSSESDNHIGLQWFGRDKGRGVIALKSIKQRVVIFKEEAFAFAPTPTIQEAINQGQACGFCGKLFLGKTALVIPCTAHDSLSEKSTKKGASGKKVPTALVKKAKAEKVETSTPETSKPKCSMKFCNSLCRDRCSHAYGPLTCPLVNPSYATLLAWSESADKKNGKQNSLGTFKILARIIVAALRDGFTSPTVDLDGTTQSAKDLLYRAECLTAINEITRLRAGITGVDSTLEWVTAYRYVMEALQLPDRYYQPTITDTPAARGAPADASKSYPGAGIQRSAGLPNWLKDADLPQELAAKILGFENFLIWLSRVSLNQEDDGGVYFLHPCLNHSCEPNAIVKRTPSLANQGAREAKPSRIYVIASRDIAPGEEITITYVNPDMPIEIRRNRLHHSYLFECGCPKCEREIEERKEQWNSRISAGHSGTSLVANENVDEKPAAAMIEEEKVESAS